MNPEQGWEPIPRHHVSDDIVLDTDFVRAKVDRHGGWAVVRSKYHRTGTSDSAIGDDASMYLFASNVVTPLYDDSEKLFYTRHNLPSGNAVGETITAIIWPGRHPNGTLIISDTFFPETVRSLADLRARAAAIGANDHLSAFLTRFDTSLRKRFARFPVPVGIVLCVRRPFQLMNRQTDIELIPYAFEVRPVAGRQRLYPRDCA